MPFLTALAALACTQSNFSDKPTLYLVGYSHLDTEWCWNYRHSILDFIPKTLKENFELFETYPNYVFNWTGAKRYQFMKDYYPAEYKKLKQYVKQGRWVVTGSGLDECDANIPAPESIIRQVLYSNRFFKKEFGVESNNYLVPDVFGFPASLPSTLAHAGLKGMSTCKLSYYPDTSAPIPFNIGRWVGPDGNFIVGALNCQSYHTGVKEDLSSSKTILARMADQKAKSGLLLDYTYYGQGDQGGSPGPNSVAWVEKSKTGSGPIRVIAKAADQMFDDLSTDQVKSLPSYQGELLISKHSAGTATSGATMKRWNHRNELLADAAERSSVAAKVFAGTAYPQAKITDAWQRFLGGQMHDILPGTSIPQAYAYAWNDQVVALNESADVVTSSVAEVGRLMDTRAKGRAVVVFNPVSSNRNEVVETTLETGSRVVGPDGNELPSQRIGDKLLFRAAVPSVGFSVFDVRSGESHVKSKLRVSSTELENDRYRVHLNQAGDISSVFDKTLGKELLSGPIRLAFLHQKPTRHPAWNMDWQDQKQPPIGFVDGPAKVTILENGPVRVALKVEREARGSKFESVVRLTDGGENVEFLQTIDWRSKECSLKAVFPLSAKNEKATYDCGIGTVQRGNNWEKLYEGPSQRWFDLTDVGGGYGVSVLSEAKYGSDKPDNQTLRLTLLYTPGVTDRFQHQGTGDWGRHEIRYAIHGHSGDWKNAQTPNKAARFVQPLMPFATASHAGQNGRSLSLVSSSDPNVEVMALKQAEDSDEIVVRVLEKAGKSASHVKLNFGRPVLASREIDGQEHAKTGLVDVSNFSLSPYSVRSFAVRLKSIDAQVKSILVVLPQDAELTNGRGFDGKGLCLPSELLPQQIQSGRVSFSLSQQGVRCDGQNVSLPKGRTLYLLAASASGDRSAEFLVDAKPNRLNIQAWDGFVGQWDTRLWDGATEDEQTGSWPHALLGIAPGYIKRAPIAWYADHRKLADGTNDAYHFAYLFRYAIPLPAGAKTVTLPKDPSIVILAASVSDVEEVTPLNPLYDTLQDHPSWKAP